MQRGQVEFRVQRNTVPSGIAADVLSVPSVRSAGKANTPCLAFGMAMARAWLIWPRWSSPMVIVPATTGRLVAVEPHDACAPGHESDV